MQLRKYQEETLYHLIESGLPRECVSLPTGSGKTIIFSSFVCEQASRGLVGLILVNRQELLTQTIKTLQSFGIRAGIISADSQKTLQISRPDNALFQPKCYVAMVETLNRRSKQLASLRSVVDYLIVDECHIGSFNKLIDGWKRVIGFSATPMYITKERSLSDLYHNLYVPIQIPDLVDQGYLSKVITYGTKKSVDRHSMKINSGTGDYDEGEMGRTLSGRKYITAVLEQVRKHCVNKRTIIYNASIEHSKLVTATLRENGINAYHIDGTSSKEERQSVLGKLSEESDIVISNVGVLTFGFDCPEIEVIILNRLTTSLSLYLQMCGRGSRISSLINKSEFSVLDMCNNWEMHGTWDEKRKWEKLFNKKREKKSDRKIETAMRICTKCMKLIPVQTKVCECGNILIEKIEIKPEKRSNVELVRLDMNASVKKMLDHTKQKGYNDFYTLHQMKETLVKTHLNTISYNDLLDLMYDFTETWCKETGKAYSKWLKSYVRTHFNTFYNDYYGAQSSLLSSGFSHEDMTDDRYCNTGRFSKLTDA